MLRKLMLSLALLPALVPALAGCGGAGQDSLSTFGGVFGSVSDAETSLAITGAAVSVGGVEASTDSEGRFRIPNVPVGEQLYAVSATGYRSAAGNMVRVQPGISTALEVALDPQQTDVGDIHGTVLDGTDGTPLGGVTVTAGTVSTVTDSRGQYVLEDVPVGQQTVTFDRPDLAPATGTVTVVENTSQELNSTLSLVQSGAIAGTVVDSRSGSGIEGVAVFIADVRLSTTTDENGQYVLEDVPTGTHSVSYDRTGYQSETFAVTVVATGTTSQDVSLVAPAVGAIRGLTLDAATGEIVAGVYITVSGLGRQATSGEDGTYSFADIPAGDYELVAAAAGYAQTTTPFLSVTAAVTTPYDIQLTPLSGQVVGFVFELGAGGELTPIQGASVSLGSGTPVTTDASGRYVLTNVAPLPDGQEYTIYVTASGYRLDSVTVTVEPGAIVEAPDLVLTPVTD